MVRLFDYPGYAKFWAADSVSAFGTYVTMVALPTLAILTLDATDVEVGVLNGARWAPYLLFGLLAGVVADRYRRRPILVATDLSRGLLLMLIPLLAITGTLNIYALMVFVAIFGAMSLLYDAAHQSYLPRLVAPVALTPANARMEQSMAVAQTTGPFLGGALIAAIGAPLAILVDAVSYLFSGLLLATIRVAEPVLQTGRRDLRAEVREGLTWVYRHQMLASYALTLHARFLFGSILGTVFTLFVLRGMNPGLSEPKAAFGLGVVLALGGVGAVVGSAFAGRAGRRWGVGRVTVAGRAIEPIGWAVAALAVSGWLGWAMAGAAQFIIWVALGMAGPNEMGYRQAVTPDRLQGRMNATIRSLNWGMFTIGAPMGGLLAHWAGYRAAMWIGIAGLAIAAVAVALSPFRNAVHPEPALVPA